MLASGPLWPVHFLPALDEGEIQSRQLFCGVGQAHLPTLVILVVGALWALCGWSEGIDILLSALSQLYHTWLIVWL
jgi:hypothetical protein